MNADPALVRIAWALLVPLTGGIAFVAYIVAWIVVPEEPPPAVDAAHGVVSRGVAPRQRAVEQRRGDAGCAPEARGGAGDRAALLVGGGLSCSASGSCCASTCPTSTGTCSGRSCWSRPAS